MTSTGSQDDLLHTSFSAFLLSNPDPGEPPISLLLRGVNLSPDALDCDQPQKMKVLSQVEELREMSIDSRWRGCRVN